MNRKERRYVQSTAGIREQIEHNKTMRENLHKAGEFVTLDYRTDVTVNQMMFGMVADWVEANVKGKSKIRWQEGKTYPEYAFELSEDRDDFDARWGKSDATIVSEGSQGRIDVI